MKNVFPRHSFGLAVLVAMLGLAAAPSQASLAANDNAIPSVNALPVPAYQGPVFRAPASYLAPQTAGPCSCVVYVQNAKTGYTGVQYAYQLNNWLPYHGWYRDGSSGTHPSYGDVMVFQPGAYYAASAGHTAIVQSASSNGNGSWNLTMKSANWSVGGNYFTDYNCTNVRNTTFTYYGDTGITFWHR